LKLSIAIFSYLFSLAYACEIYLNKEVLINDLVSNSKWKNIKTNCPSAKIKSFDKKIKYFEGLVPKSILTKNLEMINIKLITPNKVLRVSKISNLIKGSFSPTKIRNIHTRQNFSSTSTKGFSLKRIHNTVKLIFNDKKTKIDFRAEQKKYILFSIKNITPFDKQNILSLIEPKEEWTTQESQENIFSTRKELSHYLKYYTLKTFVKKSTPLKKTDFRKKNLLNFGHPVRVVFSEKNLYIKTSGTPQSNGGLNDSVFVKLKNNEVISAKVIDVGVVSANL